MSILLLLCVLFLSFANDCTGSCEQLSECFEFPDFLDKNETCDFLDKADLERICEQLDRFAECYVHKTEDCLNDELRMRLAESLNYRRVICNMDGKYALEELRDSECVSSLTRRRKLKQKFVECFRNFYTIEPGENCERLEEKISCFSDAVSQICGQSSVARMYKSLSKDAACTE
ncbi:uncharacterized protein LOC131950960 [Physella acuta]|uniref:uncharacterized protein LOC131950960 n=1 Tax=Physella acuta TaxID=109671 RepID=UPI0027DB7B16|nr:uncharacterized protein LOC131950960 [Physella acuta]